MPTRFGLTWKVVAVNLALVSVVLLIVYLSVEYLAADYFATLMSEYGISPTDTHGMFLEAVHRAFGWAALVSVLGAVGACYLLTRRILGPLSQMLRHTERVAKGDYRSQIEVSSRDEVGQLALAFNEMARSLDRIEALRQRMVVDVAHELRTPLTSIQGYLEALRDGVLAPSTQTLETVHEETVTLSRLVEDLLQLARAEASALQLDCRRIKLDTFIRELLSHYEQRLAGRTVSVAIDADTCVWADPAKLQRIVRNLLDNAEHHCSPGGTVCIEAEAMPDKTRICVRNTGKPVPAEHITKIFERFYRVDAARSRGHGGTGIGLAIVKELVGAHGGTVGAEACVDGMRVWFELPGDASAEQPDASRAIMDTAPHTSRRLARTQTYP